MNIIEWFNPRDPKHLRAWNHLMTDGKWPEGFVPEILDTLPSRHDTFYWRHSIAYKIAKCWVDRVLIDDNPITD